MQQRAQNRKPVSAGIALYLSLGFSAALAIVMLVMPRIFGLDHNFLLRSAGWNGQTYGTALLTGRYHKTFETSRPLWDVFWLLSQNPASLYPLVALMVGALAFTFTRLSTQVFKSVIPGMFCSLVVTFGYGDYLSNFMSGGWTLAYLVLALLALYFYLRQKLFLFALLLFLSALIRPESWMLALYFIGLHLIRRSTFGVRRSTLGERRVTNDERRFSALLLIPLLAPVLWILYDWRMSGNPLYSFQVTRNYAWFSGLRTTSFLSFWPTVGREFIFTLGIPILLLGLAAIAYRIWLKRGKDLLTDPVLIFIVVPLFGSWLTTLKGDIYVMGRFFATSLALLAFAAFYPYLQPHRRRPVMKYVFLFLPLLLAAIQAPAVFKAAGEGLRSGMHATQVASEEADSLRGRDISLYKRILIPSRRYGAFYQLLGEDYYAKFVSYRELNREVADGKDFDTLLPALALWIKGDEIGYPQIFSELQNGHTVTVGLNDVDLKFRFDLLHQTVAEGGYIYEVTSAPATQ